MNSTTDEATTDEIDHESACHYWERVPEEIPLHIEEEGDDE